MNAQTGITQPAIGTEMEGGFYAGHIRQDDGKTYAIIVAPKALGQHEGHAWNNQYQNIPGAQSWNDGLANTQAMAESGSQIAQWALDQQINGHADWYIPAMDELELLYRNLKPTTEQNWLYARAGINLSAVPTTYPYTPEFPAQTTVAPFQAGGTEAFEPELYWSSTQHAGDDACAWCQGFSSGGQVSNRKDDDCRVVLVRRVAI